MPTKHTVEKSIELWKCFLGDLYHEEPWLEANCEVCGEEWEEECTCSDGWTVDLYYFVCDDEAHVEELREMIQEAYEYSRSVDLSGVPEFYLGSDILEALDSFLRVNRGDPEEWEILKWIDRLSEGVRVEEPRDSLIKKTDPSPCSIDW